MPFRIYEHIKKSCVIALIALVGALLVQPAIANEDEYGPENLIKTMLTPFGNPSAAESKNKLGSDDTGEIAISHSNDSLSQRLTDRVSQPRLYMPGTMVIGETAEFTIHGKPGKWCALAMADKNSGAKPVCGHNLRLGPDRKVVALIKIPDGGVGTLLTATPIEGDLVGANLYFEAALWSNPDMSDVEFAQCIPSNLSKGSLETNGVLIAGQPAKTKGIRIVPDTSPLIIKSTSLSSGRPGD
jgi:hypothetical protein